MTKRSDRDSRTAMDAQAFRAAMRDVKPLSAAARAAAAKSPAPPRPRPRKLAHAAAIVNLDADMPLVNADIAPEESLSHRKPGVRDQVVRRLRRGLVPVEAQLDLHGMNQAGARELLTEFIAASLLQGLRCVQVIHGKGMRSGGRGAILKSAVNLWLRRHGDVMAFVSARPIDGGAGAMYVLLRA